VWAFASWTGRQSLLVDLESHGRVDLFDDIDLSRTVGWFTSLYPVFLDLRRAPSPGEALRSIKEQLRRIPNRGIGFGLLKYLHPLRPLAHPLRPLATETLPRAEVSFNYLGRFDQVLPASSFFTPANESTGPIHASSGRRTHLIEINALVTADQLQVDWTYSEYLHHRNTVARLAQAYLDALTDLINHGRKAKGPLPTDFSLVKLDEEKLGKLAQILGDSE
jgi:non-ribosomal peptide synthase protein (TIGR01720 family)